MVKFIKKIVIIVIVVITLLEIVIGAVPNNGSYSSMHTINVAVVFYRFDDPYVVELKQSLENIEKKNEGKVKFSFYDSKNDKVIQNKNINTLIESGEVDVLVLSLVDLINDPKEIINKIKAKNIPVIFASKRVFKVDENIVKSYDKAYYVLPDVEQGGILQGEIITNIWNKNKDDIDKNKDDVMQYILLQGGVSSIGTTDRSKYSIMTIKNAGIRVEQLASEFCNWDENLAREKMEGLLLQYSNRIEVIIANSDVMAIGAVKALQKYGYNTDCNTKTIPVIGIDAIPKSLDFIKKGYMSGTILQHSDHMAELFYEIIIHLVNNTKFDCEEKYNCDETGKIIKLPFEEYMGGY
jgi:methyl-galactoside transport system substrate-binding protein